MNADQARSEFALFVSLDPKNPRPVTRWGSHSLIAAERDSRDPRKIHYFKDRVVGITPTEMAQYGREYGRSLRNGELVERSVADFLKAHAGEERAEKKRAAEVAKEKAKREEAEKKRAEAAEKAQREAEARAEAAEKALEEERLRREEAADAKASEATEVTGPTEGEAPASGDLPEFDGTTERDAPAAKGVTDGS